MLWETLERVNRLRQQALQEQEYHYQTKKKRPAKDKQGKKSLADIYKEVEFGADARH